MSELKQREANLNSLSMLQNKKQRIYTAKGDKLQCYKMQKSALLQKVKICTVSKCKNLHLMGLHF